MNWTIGTCQLNAIKRPTVTPLDEKRWSGTFNAINGGGVKRRAFLNFKAKLHLPSLPSINIMGFLHLSLSALHSFCFWTVEHPNSKQIDQQTKSLSEKVSMTITTRSHAEVARNIRSEVNRPSTSTYLIEEATSTTSPVLDAGTGASKERE